MARALSAFRFPYYAVARGRECGIFYNEIECQKSVNQFDGAVYAKLRTKEECEQFLELFGFESGSTSDTFGQITLSNENPFLLDFARIKDSPTKQNSILPWLESAIEKNERNIFRNSVKFKIELKKACYKDE